MWFLVFHYALHKCTSAVISGLAQRSRVSSTTIHNFESESEENQPHSWYKLSCKAGRQVVLSYLHSSSTTHARSRTSNLPVSPPSSSPPIQVRSTPFPRRARTLCTSALANRT
eukprot:2024367-Rhodomonas_salina.1